MLRLLKLLRLRPRQAPKRAVARSIRDERAVLERWAERRTADRSSNH